MSENNHIEELIVRCFLGEINETELRELEIWIMESPENRNYFFELKKISDLGRRSIWSEREKEYSWQRMYNRLAAGAEQKELVLPVRASGYRLSWIRYAVIALIALSIGWGVSEWFSSDTESLSAQVEPVYNEIKIERGGRGNTILLSDGSKVTLNAGTVFRYPTGFSSVDRIVYLDGEAYFDIVKDEAKPFVVKLKKQDITVLGTSFNVNAYSDENYSIVTLISGKVSLESYNEAGEPMSKMFLKPSQRAVSDNHTGSVSLESTDSSLAYTWTEGKYRFKDEPLSLITRRLEKYYDVRVHIEEESLKQIRFTGTFSLGQDIKEVLQVLDHEKRYTVKRVEKEIFIIKK
jgi:ferric-dicitrate binding protein FerR (iron transport regulator)